MPADTPSFWRADVAYASKADDWATPAALYCQLDAEFQFTLDACAELSDLTFIGPGAASVLVTGCGWHGFVKNGEAQ